MISLRTMAIAAAMSAIWVSGCAQTPVEHDARHATATGTKSMPMGGSDAQMASMDEQMKAMQAMHDKMVAAKSPEERSAMMAEHLQVMQDSMVMMGETGPGGMMDKGGMGGMQDSPAMGADAGGMPDMHDKDPMDGDMAVHRQMMEKRMQMMQSMMQMMMDRMPSAPSKS